MAGEKRSQLPSFLRQIFPDFDLLKPAGGKGNHFTYLLEENGRRHSVRVEDGPERDAHIENVEAIAGVDGVHVLFVGSADLKLSLSTEALAPEYEDALDRALAAVRHHSIEAGNLIRDRMAAAPLLERGFSQMGRWIPTSLSYGRAFFPPPGSGRRLNDGNPCLLHTLMTPNI